MTKHQFLVALVSPASREHQPFSRAPRVCWKCRAVPLEHCGLCTGCFRVLVKEPFGKAARRAGRHFDGQARWEPCPRCGKRKAETEEHESAHCRRCFRKHGHTAYERDRRETLAGLWH